MCWENIEYQSLTKHRDSFNSHPQKVTEIFCLLQYGNLIIQRPSIFAFLKILRLIRFRDVIFDIHIKIMDNHMVHKNSKGVVCMYFIPWNSHAICDIFKYGHKNSFNNDLWDRFSKTCIWWNLLSFRKWNEYYFNVSH